MDPKNPIGNGVVIDHGNGEFSLLAHMQPKSLRVNTGDAVKAGALLGLCGNSGNTSEPHIHYHLQGGPDLKTAAGLPAPFSSLIVNGKPVAKAELLKGQTVTRGK
ncbi:MAG: M23 family metallopeptidase [Candidatus Latescibacteria bacterium]|nr:M23 family metallopeptidase [Candidatus Latescibacterota bacterium]